jgi:hypothetical protein
MNVKLSKTPPFTNPPNVGCNLKLTQLKYNKMRKNTIITILCFLLISTITNAQSSHNLKPNSLCKFVKKAKYWDYEGASSCNACAEDNKKNQAAVEMELKRRVAAGKIAEAEKLKKIQQEYVKRNAEQKAKIEAQSKNVVSFALPKTETKPTITQVEKKATSVNKGTVLYNSNRGDKKRLSWYYTGNNLLNSKGEIVLECGTKYEFFIGTRKEDSLLSFPSGIAIAFIKTKVDQFYDIIDIYGNRHFNDNNISRIAHFWGPYFFIGYKEGISNCFSKAAIYNIQKNNFQWFGYIYKNLGVCFKEIYSKLISLPSQDSSDAVYASFMEN